MLLRAPDRDELLRRLLSKVEHQGIDIVVEVMLVQQSDGARRTNVEPDRERHVQRGKIGFEKFASVLQRGSEPYLVWMVSGVPAGQARL